MNVWTETLVDVPLVDYWYYELELNAVEEIK